MMRPRRADAAATRPATSTRRRPPAGRAGVPGVVFVALLLVAVAAPAAGGGGPRGRGPRPQGAAPDRDDAKPASGYSIEQAVSDRAQASTIAFDGLAFLTGGFGQDTFFPPGKVSDYFGFQFMRDVDRGGLGHNSRFLPRIADHVLGVLDDAQRTTLVALAREQAPRLEEFERRRFVPIRAFRRLLERDLPAGSRGLDADAVAAWFADLYALDGELAWRRAQVTGAILRTLTPAQRARLSALAFDDSRTWPEVAEAIDRRTLTHREHVAVMTYGSEMFSWWAGSPDADVYFCPERHGTYFGGFYMKDIPAMRHPGTNISTTRTGDAGQAFLAALTAPQRAAVTDLVDAQRGLLAEVVATRRAICTELRRFLKEDAANRSRVVELARAYGRLDGEMSRRYATAFAEVARTLSDAQRAKLMDLRNLPGDVCEGAFLYSDPIALPDVAGTEVLFRPPAGRGR